MKYPNSTIFTIVMILVNLLLAGEKNTHTILQEWQLIYKENNAQGITIVYDLNNDQYYYNDTIRARKQYLPASTFKLLNSLIALETGAIKDENEVIKWDGVDRGIPQWNQDHCLKTAFSNSVVWFYQELSRRIGRKRMQQYVKLSDYGNHEINGALDSFWLDGQLRITPLEQIEFLKRLYFEQLPFSKRNLEIVKRISIVEQTNSYTLHAKAGWATSVFPNVGWWVGYLEQDNNVYFFATEIDILDPPDRDKREKITREILKSMNLF